MTPEEIHEEARKRFETAESSDMENRELAEDDLRKLIGDQWDYAAKQERIKDGKPCLTFNRLPSFVRQVTGQIRALNPAVEVIAADGRASEGVAEVFAGLIRHIEHESDAQSVYEQATESAAACGIGHWRIRTRFAEGDTFDQEAVIERIENPFSVFWDPAARHTSRMDAQYCFIVEDMLREDFRAEYPDAIERDASTEHRADQNALSRTLWFRPDTVAVAEYFWIEDAEREILLLDDGRVVDELPDVPEGAPVPRVVRRRKVSDRKVMWAKISGAEVLEGPVEIPSKYIPVVSVTGEEWHFGEVMYRSSVIRFAKDAQQLYNYSRSSHAEVVALQPRAPYLVTTTQVRGLEAFWKDANRSNRPYLPYNPDDKAGRPERATPPVSSSGLMSEIGLAVDDMKATTGIFDASLGAQGNEVSGIAILRRQIESQNGTSVYADNMVKAIRHTGRILVDMIPRVYDTQRAVRVLTEDDQEKIVIINAVLEGRDGAVPVNDLTVGKYDVRIGVGPSFETKREQAREGMQSFIQAFPSAAAVTADLVAKSQDWPDKDKFAARLRKIIPPGIIDADELTPEEAEAQQQAAGVAQQRAQQQQQIESLKSQAEVRRDMASAAEDEADARLKQLEAAKLQLELAVQAGLLDRAVEDAVQRALRGLPQGQFAQQRGTL